VGAFKAAMQAIVAHCAITVAVAGLLVDHIRNLGCNLVHLYLVGVREILSRQLVADKYRFERFDRRLGVVRRNILRRVGPLGRRGQCYESESKAADDTFHTHKDKSSECRSAELESTCNSSDRRESLRASVTVENKQKKAACTVFCTCREASDATCVG
jgi:hypothetical protein